MATIKQIIGRVTGAASNATRFRKSAKTSARAFQSSRPTARMRTVARRKSLGGQGG